MPTDLVTRLFLKNQDFDKNLKGSGKQLQAFEKKVDAMAVSVRSFVGGFAGMAGVSFAFMDIAQKSMQFEKSLSSLRSLTGVSAKELEYFKNEAIKMGATSTQTASQVVEAFQLIGSQKPELLKNKAALAEVTNQAIILAEAAGMEVPEAAKALTGSLNQMGESANKAGEYINILAAASQAGSADIPYLTKAIEKSGGAASSVGIKYNELVAAIEAIAPKVSEASEAGTNLRNIFLILESSADKNLKPSVVGLSTALENLAAKNYDATQMTKLFGRESVTAALAIVNAKDDYKNYLEAITGTNTALEQQKINNDNLAGSINAVSSAWEGFVLTINNSNGVLKDTVDLLANLLGRMTEYFKSDQQKQNAIIQEGVKERKKTLEKEIEGWMVLGDRKKAITETMRQFSLRNPGGEDTILSDMKNEVVKLENLQSALKKYQPQTGFDKALHATVPYSFLSPAGVAEKNKLEDQIGIQRKLISDLEIKRDIYKQSVQFLNDELKATEKIENANNTTSGAKTVTDEMRKKWKNEAIIQKIEFDIDSDLKDKIRDIPNMERVKIPATLDIYDPEGSRFEEEVPDMTGSIEAYQKRLQAVTVSYNEATTDELRAIYSKQRADLEKHLEEMTDMNQGMIDISQELENLVQSGLVSGFESLGEVLASEDAGEAMRNMLIGLMDMLKQFGAALVAAGMAKIAFDKLLINPFAAIAAGGALIVATSAAKAALNKSVSTGNYTEGGVAPYYTVGDRLTAQINGGEMILNTDQQAKLFEMLNVGRTFVDNSERELTGRLVGEGSQLVALIEYTNKKRSRGK
ncbi:phage tail tape measure protein [Parabacteroides acidifaciens]|uniref:Phage tail tape measure protein n=1 Tax=Parabacteroides acidifaciens TaxID=2290935 RepID=A0A3D8HB68_9BACT|nr:phage tail tape measure protein [Parabacteroides acidifaciens]MBC8603158.1 phage tail tape measure protein [Parabacteroides acidifaciens]RDU48091.1 phage tail tape measure protein [Parabacteroides acidifaciens]